MITKDGCGKDYDYLNLSLSTSVSTLKRLLGYSRV
jgi:hypothetical protein